MQHIVARIPGAARRGRRQPLRIRGGGTKDWYGQRWRGRDPRHARLCRHRRLRADRTGDHGALRHAAGRDRSALAERSQMLAFEPPAFRCPATFGGMVASGLSGPRRASAGALRDFVLGARLLDGNGEVLNFGGQVMKNVAGYDVSRLLAGSLGTLGLLLEVSVKVLPLPCAKPRCASR
jgi:glycolate oxidase FAD binding subunit